MILEIITPDRKVYSGEVRLVQLPGTTGSFELLKNHAPIISTLKNGTIKAIPVKGETEYFEVEGGVVEASDNRVIVLAETA